LEVAKILKRDAANRRTSLTEEVGALRKMIAQPPAGTTPGTTLPPNYDGEVEQGGVRYHVKTDATGKVTFSEAVGRGRGGR
jgi:hypothetical protein